MRKEALKRGLRSSIGLPLRANSHFMGAMTLYSDQPNAFDEDEQAVLARVASDISYWIESRRAGTHPAGQNGAAAA